MQSLALPHSLERMCGWLCANGLKSVGANRCVQRRVSWVFHCALQCIAPDPIGYRHLHSRREDRFFFQFVCDACFATRLDPNGDWLVRGCSTGDEVASQPLRGAARRQGNGRVDLHVPKALGNHVAQGSTRDADILVCRGWSTITCAPEWQRRASSCRQG